MTGIILGAAAISIPVSIVLWLLLRRSVQRVQARTQTMLERSFDANPDAKTMKAVDFMTGTRFGRAADARPCRMRHPDLFLLSTLLLSTFVLSFFVLLNNEPTDADTTSDRSESQIPVE